jgi:predicted RNA-binding Zn-ribbon protein involved in translation (DUF1610 family)
MKEVRKTENTKVHEKEEKSCVGDTKSEANKTQIDVPGDLSWKQCSVKEGKISFECPKCKETHRVQTTLFSSQSATPTEGLMRTSEKILWGREIRGIVVAFMVAFAIGLFLTFIFGPHIWNAFVAALVYLGLRKVFIPKYMRKLSVWAFKCKNCGNRIFIASDGTVVAISEIQANVGE